MRMGLPQVLTTDQGSEFVNQLDDELMTKLGIDHRLTTPYHLQVCLINLAHAVGRGGDQCSL